MRRQTYVLVAHCLLVLESPTFGFVLDEVILKDIIFPGSSKCTTNDSTEISFVHTPSPSYWDPINANLESKKFMAQMTHNDSDPSKSWTVRFGHGGDIYSMISGYGEAIPPQTKDFSVWVDEVTQAVTVDLTQNNCAEADECYYIHQAGAYFRPGTFDYLNETFYSPNVAKHCEGNTCIFATWGQIASIPTVHESDLIYVHQYRNCGNGVLEYTQMFIGYFGGQLAYLNMPWAGVRTSSLPDIYLSNTDFTMQPKLGTIQNWGVNDILLDLPETGGYTTFAQDVENDPGKNAALSYVHGICDEYSDSSNNYFRAPSRMRFGLSQRDFTVWTTNGRLTSRSSDNSFVHRQFLINDKFGNITAQALNLYDEAYGDMLTPSDYNGRTLEIYSVDSNTFGVAAASDLGGTQTTCAKGTSVCVGSTVPRSGHVPFFQISCGNSKYFGSNKYIFAADRDNEGRIRSYVCEGKGVGVTPELKMLGFFEIGMCNSLQEATYDPDFCDEEPTANPTVSPTAVPTNEPTDAPTDSPTDSPTLEPTDAPTAAPTLEPTFAPTESPTEKTREPTANPTVPPTAVPTNEPTDTPTFVATDSPTDSPTDSTTLEPTAAPTAAPTLEPTFAPTESPTEAPITCEDSGLPISHRGRLISCAQVAARGACSNPKASSHCPQSCDECQEYACENSLAPWKINGKKANCGILANLDPSDIAYFCAASSALSTTCRSTCGFCNN